MSVGDVVFKVFARIDAFQEEIADLRDRLVDSFDAAVHREEEIRDLRRQLDNMRIALDALNKVAYPDRKQ